MPPGLVEGIDRMDSAGRRRTLRSIGRASESSGFEAACEAALRVVEGGRVPCVPSSKNRQIRLSNFDTLMLTASGRAGAVAAGPPAA